MNTSGLTVGKSCALGLRIAAGVLILVATQINAAPVDDPDPTPVTQYYEQGLLIRSGETVEALGPNLMGDSVNEYSGSLSFGNTDVSLPGNNALPVAVGRRFTAGVRLVGANNGLFGDWDLELPYLRTLAGAYGSFNNWYGNGSTSPNLLRCSQFQVPPYVPYPTTTGLSYAAPYQYWDGYTMHIPGAGDQTLLSRAQTPSSTAPPTNTSQPTDGAVYPVLTKQHWQFSCLPTMSRGSGEGFLARSPDGTRYQFDHMVSRAFEPYVNKGSLPRN